MIPSCTEPGDPLNEGYRGRLRWSLCNPSLAEVWVAVALQELDGEASMEKAFTRGLRGLNDLLPSQVAKVTSASGS
jgi:hypothetical protein